MPAGTLMEWVLWKNSGIDLKWAAERCSTTYENAKFKDRILREHGIARVYLMSQGGNLPAFEVVVRFAVLVLSKTSGPLCKISRLRPVGQNLAG